MRKDGTRFWANVVDHRAARRRRGTLRGFAKVTRDLTERRRADEALRKKNVDLEAQVRKAATTKELEAFSYSVSHDPGRAAARPGRVQQAAVEAGDKLDARGARTTCARIRDAAQQMSRLIDAIC